MRIPVLLFGLLVAVGPLWATEAVESLPGYVDLSQLRMPGDARSSVEVFLKGPVLRLVAAASQQQSPEVAALLSRLQLIRVQGYTVTQADRGAVQEQFAALTRSLVERQWESVAHVRDQDDLVHLLVKASGDSVSGLMVMSLEKDGEAVFVNIVGNLDPAQLGRIGSTLDIDGLDSLRLERHDVRGR